MGVAGLVLGIVGVLVAFAPGVFGLLAICAGTPAIVFAIRARRRGQRLGAAALALGIVAVVLGLVVPAGRFLFEVASAWN